MVVPEDQSGTVLRCSQCNGPLEIPAVQVPPPPPDPPSAIADEQPAIVVDTRIERRPPAPIDGARRQLWLIALALLGLAVLGAVPVALALCAPNEFGAVRLERWACAVLLLGFLELCYTVYLLQLPDWSSLRVVSIVTLGIAAVYAAVAGVRLLAAPGNRLLEFWELDGNVFSSSQEVLWCLMLVLLTGSLSYVVGHLSTQWSRRGHTTATERSAAGR
jgi:hypothetical protein